MHWHREKEMNTPPEWKSQEQDPLGLGELPMLEPDQDGWPVIERALLQSRKRRRVMGGWLAAAASLLLVVSLSLRLSGPGPAGTTQPIVESVATETASVTSESSKNTVESLIAMSQVLEQQLRGLREETGSMPADSAVYVAELEDLVAQVDSELSYSPDSINLWGQRVNLLLDLAQIYQHQWEREYGRMASL
jgi:hypothetical protein